MTDHEVPTEGEVPQPAPRKRFYKRIKRKHSWLRDRWDPTKEELERVKNADLPPDVDIVAGFLMSNSLIFGVPEKAEIFRLSEVTFQADQSWGGEPFSFKDALHLWIVDPTPIPTVHYVVAHEPLGIGMGDLIEHNYNVRLTALSKRIHLGRIRVIHGSKTDESQALVFEGTELPGAAGLHRIRVLRVTVHEGGWATYEVVAETRYPTPII